MFPKHEVELQFLEKNSNILTQVRRRASRLNGHMLSGVLQGLSALDYSPGQEWLQAVVLSAGPSLARMQAKKLTKVRMLGRLSLS